MQIAARAPATRSVGFSELADLVRQLEQGVVLPAPVDRQLCLVAGGFE